ncbi:MAG: phosphoribosylformylglycinamidine synthase subunit PurQ [Spirochaetes bacterium]|nr:phosphoribosylformylglycinamidine synthase subunit PurQ [Spirochaetota bacterium]
MPKPRALILTGYGINCEEETAFAFNKAGAVSSVMHINEIIDSPGTLFNYQIFAFPGGFAYGDDTGAGKAMANKIKNNLSEEFRAFIEKDKLILGICNGFQVMVNLGILPAMDGVLTKAEISLEYNRTFRYECRWVDLNIADSPSVFTKDIESMRMPVAHGEGNFIAQDEILSRIEKNSLVAMRYSKPDGSRADGEFPYNPNGSINDIAAVCDRSGRMMGMMPHPERNILFTQRDDWTYLKEKAKREGYSLPEESEGLMIFKNAVKYFM